MPLYEYRCKTCGEVFEKMVRWSEADHSPVCPKCQSQDTQRKMSHVASFGSSGSTGYSGGSSCGTGGHFS
ncbi:MAG TPA: zinc ribbon domain-containing protein [Anaerolineales bacterium]